MNDVDLIILSIPFGKDNAISRDALAAKLNTTDRKMRQMIEDARNQGVFILNDGDGKGYYQTTDLDDLERSYRVDKARALAIFKRQKEIRRTLKAAGRQV